MNPSLFTEMLELQDEFQQLIRNDWKKAGWDFPLAIAQECAELIDCFPWKWWKAAPIYDRDNVLIELVDIWHFVLSAYMARNSHVPLDKLGKRLFDEYPTYPKHALSTDPVVFARELMANAAFGNVHLAAFSKLLTSCGFSLRQLRAVYIGKVTLNHFRNLNGYADGTYQKEWMETEDNAVLMQILPTFSYDDPGLFDALLAALSELYQEATGIEAVPSVAAVRPVPQPDGIQEGEKTPAINQAFDELITEPDFSFLDDTSGKDNP